MTTAYLNRIATAVPANDVHQAFVAFATSMLEERRAKALFARMAGKAEITHRYSFLAPAADPSGAAVDDGGFFTRGKFPATAPRMQLYEKNALALSRQAVDRLELGETAKNITHVIVTSCTGLYAPGIDLDLIGYLGLKPTVERTMVGFMGCYAAINALKLARHIVRSDEAAQVLLVNLELCTLHLQETQDLEQVLSFLVFGDGAAASIVSAMPVGFALDSFHAVVVPETSDLITWRIGALGFDMLLSGQVPGAVGQALTVSADDILGGALAESIDLWAVHPGGRSVLDAVEKGLALGAEDLAASRAVLRDFGNMSSATVMFVLQKLLATAKTGETGCAMSFGPGLTAETMLFHAA
jgi:predicted naringenin-chalcone synthase